MVAADAWIAVYMMTDRYRGTLYTGVTGQFRSRITQHREGVGGFTRRYGLKRLVWYEIHDQMTDAIQRETSIKRYLRAWKLRLIEEANPSWEDLSDAWWDPD